MLAPRPHSNWLNGNLNLNLRGVKNRVQGGSINTYLAGLLQGRQCSFCDVHGQESSGHSSSAVFLPFPSSDAELFP